MGELTAEERAEMERLDAEMEAMDREVEARIATSQNDPTSQMYFLRMDTKTVVQRQQEYDYCNAHRVPMRMVSYNSAIDHLHKEEAAKRKLAARRKHNKIARRQARVNRKKR